MLHISRSEQINGQLQRDDIKRHTESGGNYCEALKPWLFVTADNNLCSHKESSHIYTVGAQEKHELLASKRRT